MKPKKRYQQTQSGRLFMRDKDHRDVVYQDKYHNALLWKEENGKESVWVRYPRRTCILNVGENHIAMLDVDRRCIHKFFQELGQRTQYIIPFKNLLVYVNYYGNIPTLKVSEDGQVWYPVQGISEVINSHSFDDDSVYVYSRSTVTDSEGRWAVLGVTRVQFYKDSDGNWKTSTSYRSFKYASPRTNTSPTVMPLDATHNGLIVIHDVVTQEMDYPYPQHPVEVYQIDSHLNQTYLGEFFVSGEAISASFNVQYHTNARGLQLCQKGSFLCLAVVGGFRTRKQGDYAYFIDKVTLYGSSDNGATWVGQEVYRSREHNQYEGGWNSSERYFRLIYRKSKFYLYFYHPFLNNFQCWASDTGCGDFYQVNLPEYVDVPIEQNPSGYYSAQYPSHQTVRLKLLQPAPNGSDGNANFLNAFTLVLYQYQDFISIMDFLNGEQTDVSNKEEHLCFVADGYLFYFDNMALVCNDNCYAIQLASTTDEQSFEHLMEGDYCYRGTTPPIYPYWNPYTQYNVGDIVIYGDTFECLIANKNQVPRAESIYWRKQE